MFLTLPVAGSFWSSCLVKGQSPFLYGIKEDLPCLNEVPVGQMLLGVIRVGGAGPVHQVEVDIVQAKALKGRINALRNAVVPGVIELGCNPDLIAGDTGISNTRTDLSFVAVRKSTKSNISKIVNQVCGSSCNSRVDVTITHQQSILNGLADLIGPGLPGAQANGRDLSARVKGIGLPMARNQCLVC